MLGNLLKPFTTATSVGVAIRYLVTIAGSVVTILGILGLLSAEQVEAITKTIPDLATPLAALVTAAITLYAIVTKSSSDKAAEAAKQIDAKIEPATPVVIKTPAGVPDIVVSADKK